MEKNTFHLMNNGYTVCDNHWGMTNEYAIFNRIYYVYDGEAYMKYNQKIIPLKKGNMYILPVMNPYTLYHNIENPFEVLWFHVEYRLNSVQVFSDFMELMPKQFEHNILEAIRELTDQAQYYTQLTDLVQTVCELLRERIGLFDVYKYTGMNGLFSHIEEMKGDKLTVEMLAQFVGMERSAFSRKFRNMYGISPNHYLLDKKISLGAKSLLSGASIEEAANISGYHDEKSFSRAFKARMEISPAEYRKQRVIYP